MTLESVGGWYRALSKTHYKLTSGEERAGSLLRRRQRPRIKNEKKAMVRAAEAEQRQRENKRHKRQGGSTVRGQKKIRMTKKRQRLWKTSL